MRRYGLKLFRQSKGLTQKMFAKKCGVSIKALRDIEYGRSIGGIEFWNNLRREFNLTNTEVDALQHGKEIWSEMTYKRAMQILDPNANVAGESIEAIDEACRIGMNAIKELIELKSKINNGQLAEFNKPFYSQQSRSWCVFIRNGDQIESLQITKERAEAWQRETVYD